MSKFYSLSGALLLGMAFGLVACEDSATSAGNSESTPKVDTLYVTNSDTVTVIDTLIKKDTVVKKDTIVKENVVKDTVIEVKKDTVVKNDTVTVVEKDTIETLKAMCGEESYDITEKVCLGGGNLRGICGVDLYDLKEESCVNDSVYVRCGDDIFYNPVSQFCVDFNIVEKCGGAEGRIFNIHTEFCFENNIYKKCAKQKYDPSIESCVNDTLYSICTESGKKYNTVTQFCGPYGSVMDKCDGFSYNKDYYTCDRGGLAVRGVERNYFIQTIGDLHWMSGNYAEDETGYKKCGGGTGAGEVAVEGSCDVYGGLYSVDFAYDKETNSVKDHCPYGWRLPTIDEFYALEDILKTSPAFFGNHAGYYVLTVGGFTGKDESAYFWTSSFDPNAKAFTVFLMNGERMGRGTYATTAPVALSVRCVREASKDFWNKD